MNDLLTPQLTEKSYQLAKNLNVYVFKADPKLNINQIKSLLETEYNVVVKQMRVANYQGKRARSIHLKTRSARQIGKRSNWKKVYATLKTGDLIPVFTDFNQQDNPTNN